MNGKARNAKPAGGLCNHVYIEEIGKDRYQYNNGRFYNYMQQCFHNLSHLVVVSLKKSPLLMAGSLIFALAALLLTFVNSLWGTYTCARTAVYTQFGVDRIFVTLWNCALGAFVDTGTASNAVVWNYVSHSCKILIVFIRHEDSAFCVMVSIKIVF